MKLFSKSYGEINLNKNHYLGAGGEGQIFAKGSTAYKIYFDSKKMIPLGKIQELAAITDNNVIRPLDVLYDKKNGPVGYSMRFLQNSYVLCQLFTKAFRERNGIDHSKMLGLVKSLRQIVYNIHSANILIVDLNEMNFLTNNIFNEIFAIDTDSYKTKSYPATAIMPSVRDYHSSSFSELTDWFSFGILSFQMFVGIHPFKGKHSSVNNLEERMRKNISVFSKDVSVPKICYPFDIIPEVYRNWYKAIFDGKRLVPPVDFTAPVYIITNVPKLSSSPNIEISELREVDSNIVSVVFYGGNRLILTNNKFYIDNRNFNISPGLKIGLTIDNVFLAKTYQGELKVFNTSSQKEIDCKIFADEIMEYKNNLYIKKNDCILKIEFTELKNNKVLIGTKHVANVLENATKLFDGVVIQNLLGACYVSFFPTPTVHKQAHIKELDKYSIVDAKYDSNVLVVIGVKRSGIYDRFVIRFASDDTYDVRIVEDIDNHGINFTVLDNGICVLMNENDSLELFSSKKESSNIKVVADDILAGDMKLISSGSNLLFAHRNKLFSMKMKKTS